jgi:hypothetical protein
MTSPIFLHRLLKRQRAKKGDSDQRRSDNALTNSGQVEPAVYETVYFKNLPGQVVRDFRRMIGKVLGVYRAEKYG